MAAAAAAAIAVALIAPGSSPGSPSVAQAAVLGSLKPVLGPPQVRSTDPAQLRVAVGPLHFPNWSATIGWHAVGQRRDLLRGRTVLTVYYAKAGRTVAYSIVAGSPLPRPPAPATNTRTYGLQSFHLNGRTVVTWREAGHTCLLSGARLSERVLAALVAHT
jgi:hypothetical protein